MLQVKNNPEMDNQSMYKTKNHQNHNNNLTL